MELSVNYNYSPQAAIEQSKKIKHQLYQYFSRSDNRIILMLDAALLRHRRDIHDFISAINQRSVKKVPVAPEYLTEEFFPWLLELDLSLEDDAILLDKSIDIALNEIEPRKIKSGNGRLISGWLSSHSPVDITAQHMANTALQNNNDARILLRYYDPGVAILLWEVIDSWQRQRILGPITAWFSVDGDGELIHRKGLVQQYKQLSYSLSLSPDTWKEIDLIRIVNLILREYRFDHADKPRFSEVQAFHTALPALKRAVNYAFKDSVSY
jgi:hypothetical protein